MSKSVIKAILSPVFILLATSFSFAQTPAAPGQLSVADSSSLAASDSTTRLKAVSIKAYLQEQPLFRLTTAASTVDSAQLARHNPSSLLPAVNTIPGVRMEERSPGSYRLSVRGSLLRSPFGVRNIKVYYDEIPLTDAGGNTYLNSLDAGALSSLSVLRGPDGSLFGANSGGVLLLSPVGMGRHSDQASASVSAGSYGLFHQQLGTRFQVSDKYRFSLNQAYLSSDGYRDHSGMKRKYFQTVQRWNYQPNAELRVLGFYSDMQYQTPGGLNAEQAAANPRSARPAAGPNPGAEEQRAGIYNKTLFGGIVHDIQISPRLKHVVSLFGTHTDFENPFISNYEYRKENNIGLRSYLNFTDRSQGDITWLMSAGLEVQKGNTSIENYDNNRGIRGDEQSGDKLKSSQHFYFLRFQADWKKRLFLEAASSVNFYSYSFKSLFPEAENQYNPIRFQEEWMPRLALSYVLLPDLSWRVSVGRGFSPPTTAEVRPSGTLINTGLRAETGWNYETGFRWFSRWIEADASVFIYKMKDALVRQSLEDGSEYFSNAGSVEQRGLEIALKSAPLLVRPSGLIRSFQLGSNLTFSNFNFGDYVQDDNDYSDNRLTGVPKSNLVNFVSVQFPAFVSLYVQHQHSSSIPLNDANSVSAEPYNLLQAKIDYRMNLGKKRLNIYFSADNLLNETYSLGNDINAFGGRYFNPSPLRNFNAGASLHF